MNEHDDLFSGFSLLTPPIHGASHLFRRMYPSPEGMIFSGAGAVVGLTKSRSQRSVAQMNDSAGHKATATITRNTHAGLGSPARGDSADCVKLTAVSSIILPTNPLLILRTPIWSVEA